MLDKTEILIKIVIVKLGILKIKVIKYVKSVKMDVIYVLIHKIVLYVKV